MLIGRCLPYGEGITYWPLAEVAKAHAGILDNDPAEAALAKFRAAIESVDGDEHSDRALDAAAWAIGFSLPGTPVTDSDPREAVRLLEEGWARYVSALATMMRRGSAGASARRAPSSAPRCSKRTGGS